MEINILDIIIHLINIFVLFIILRFLVYKPVSKLVLYYFKKIVYNKNVFKPTGLYS